MRLQGINMTSRKEHESIMAHVGQGAQHHIGCGVARSASMIHVPRRAATASRRERSMSGGQGGMPAGEPS